jgi:hypothetical protein
MFQSTLRLNRSAVAGASAIGLAVAISSFTVARAERAKADNSKTYSCSTGTACLEGSSTGGSTTGVEGTSTKANGVEGTTTATNGDSAVAGISSGATGHANGVYGRSSNGPGVYGSSSTANAVEGHASTSGSSGIAGFALNTSQSNSGIGVSAEAAGYYEALYAQADSANTYIFEGFNTATGGYCHIDEIGNLGCSGSEDVKAVRTRHLNSDGQHVLAYAAESASATLDDVGTGRMVGGIAHVVIDRAFGSAIDRNSPYHVFLTPMGDTRGLYVSAKAPSGFEVRETQGGRSTLSFDYRIVARPLDAKDDRLPIAPAARVPTARQPRKGTL